MRVVGIREDLVWGDYGCALPAYELDRDGQRLIASPLYSSLSLFEFPSSLQLGLRLFRKLEPGERPNPFLDSLQLRDRPYDIYEELPPEAVRRLTSEEHLDWERRAF